MNTTEKKVSHTPGPWNVRKNNLMISIHTGKKPQDEFNDNSICGIWSLREEANANAKLIAAAPELLEALKNIVALNGVGYGTNVAQFVTDLQPFILEAQNAIAKATE